MKRHPAFQDLSRDHSVVLNRVLQVVRSVEGHPMAKPLGESLPAFVRLWTHDGLPGHFAQEETDLLPVLRSKAPDLADRLLREHEAARGGFEGLLKAAEPQEAARLAAAVRAHIRWEEEAVFGWLQANLPEAELRRLLAKSQLFRAKNRLPAACPV